MLALCFCMCTLSIAAPVHSVYLDTIPANGIYMKASDFLSHTLLYSSDSHSSNKTYKIKIRNSLHRLQINDNGKVAELYFDDIWGFRLNNEDWRLFGDRAYKVTNTEKIFLYTYSIPSEYGAIDATYYSRNETSPVKKLNKINLLETFHSSDSFVKKLKGKKWYKTVFSWSRVSDHFEFIDWLP